MSTYVNGHAPTSTDYRNATSYANDVMEKEACLSRPDLYEWHASKVTRYPCPQGLSCETGVCKFKESACRSMSEVPYHDCVRKSVSCDTHPSGFCDICDYDISLGHNITGPYTTDAPDGCYAGDSIRADDIPHPQPHTTTVQTVSGFCDHDDQCLTGSSCVMAEPDDVFSQMGRACSVKEDCGGGRSVCSNEGYCVADVSYEGSCVVACSTSADCEFDPAARCGTDPQDASLYGRCYLPSTTEPTTSDDRLCPQPDTLYDPYTVEMYEEQEDGSEKVVNSRVACTSDVHCSLPPGVGGVCGLDPSKSTYGFCYDSAQKPYLEWRDEVQMWNGLAPNKNVCLETLPYMRKWCEMPWTRAGMDEDDQSQPLSHRVKGEWKSRARPPFWYNEDDGTCHVTKKYCTNNLKDGGFSAGYGGSRDYWLGSTCTGSQDKEVVGGYDCCTTLGSNISEFFLGRTLTTDFKELVTGDVEGFGARWGDYRRRLAEATTVEVGGVEWNPVTGVEGVEGVPFTNNYNVGAISDVVNFVCDPRLKTNLVKIRDHVLGPGYAVHGYQWTWNEDAMRLFGLRGESCGMLIPEVFRYFPDKVSTTRDGVRFMSITPSPRDQDSNLLMRAMMKLKLKLNSNE